MSISDDIRRALETVSAVIAAVVAPSVKASQAMQKATAPLGQHATCETMSRGKRNA